MSNSCNCPSCPYYDKCENTLKSVKNCSVLEGLKTFTFGQGCWDGEDFNSYVSCLECFHNLQDVDVCKAVREEGQLFLTFIEMEVRK